MSAVSQIENGIKVIVANPAMIDAYRDGVPGNGKPFADGSKVAKIEWTSKKSVESPYFVMIPDTLKSVSFIEQDINRFPDTHGWAYAQFLYDAASGTLTPDGRRRQVRVRVPYDGGGKRLYFHGVPEEVNEGAFGT